MKKVFKYLIITLLLFLSININGQTKTVDEYKVMYITNIIRYIKWDIPNNSNQFIIGVLNNQPIYDYFYKYSNHKNIGNKKIIIKNFNDIKSITKCDILYFSNFNNSKKNINLINNLTNTLIITDYYNATYYGSCINFIINNNKLHFEISQKNLKKHNISVSGDLLSKTAVILK